MIKIGVFGVRRGGALLELCEKVGGAKVVAICDNDADAVQAVKQNPISNGVTFYAGFDEFIKHDMDAVVLANCAHEHAPYAIKCLDAGLNVFSEVLPCQCMAEAVALVEAVERSGKKYIYGENYCYMPATREMKRLYRSGALGEFEYGEGEYLHNCEPIWPEITYGDRNHWRNSILYATFYCTHSLGPLIHIAGMRPVKVTGLELPYTDMCARMGRRSGIAGIEMVEMENGGIVRSVHGNLNKGSVMYRVYGSKGRAESAQADAGNGGTRRIYVNVDEEEGECGNHPETYMPFADECDVDDGGHVGADRCIIKNFIAALSGEDADVIDVYEALDMFLPGLFAWFSVLDGGKPQCIPDLRDKAERDKWRNDYRCTDKRLAGKRVLPSYSKCKIDIPDEVYNGIKEKYLEKIQSVRRNNDENKN